jgi:hypothetical protein
LVLRENNIIKLMFTIVQCVHIRGKIGLDGIKISVADPEHFREGLGKRQLTGGT